MCQRGRRFAAVLDRITNVCGRVTDSGDVSPTRIAKGAVSIGQVCAGHKNDLWLEVNGSTSSLRWRQERQNELWIGRRDGANMTLAKDLVDLRRDMNPTTRLTLSVLMSITVAGLSGCSSQAPAPTAKEVPSALEGTAGTVYVTNEISGDLSVIDVATARVVATIPLGKRPRGLRASPDGSLLYVALSGSPIAGPGVDESKLPPADKRADGIGIVDLRARRLLKVLAAGSDPEQVDVSADGKLLFVANEDTGQASAIDAASGELVATMKVGGEPEGVNLRPDGKEVYVTSEEDNTVSVIDAVKPRVLLTFPVGPRPRSTTFLPDSSRAFIPSENGGSIDVIDTGTHKLIARVPLSGDLQRPMGGVASKDGKFVYMTTGRGKTVAIIDVALGRHVGSIENGERPWGIAISADGKWLFTANGPSHDVSIIDVDRRVVKTRIKVGEGPWGALFVPASRVGSAF